MIKVRNMPGRSGNKVANQFILSETGNGANGNFVSREYFQSYNTIIAERIIWEDSVDITLDESTWNCSVTTSKYRSKFLNENTYETRAKIKSGEYLLANLN